MHDRHPQLIQLAYTMFTECAVINFLLLFSLSASFLLTNVQKCFVPRRRRPSTVPTRNITSRALTVEENEKSTAGNLPKIVTDLRAENLNNELSMHAA